MAISFVLAGTGQGFLISHSLRFLYPSVPPSNQLGLLDQLRTSVFCGNNQALVPTSYPVAVGSGASFSQHFAEVSCPSSRSA